MGTTDKSKGTQVRKGTRKIEARPREATPSPVTGGRGPAPKQAVDVRSLFQDVTRRADELEARVADLEEQLKKARESLVKSESRITELQEKADRTPALEQEVAAIRPQLEEARRRLKEQQAELKGVREERDRLKGEAAQTAARAAGLEARAQEQLAQLAKVTALKLEASSFRLQLDNSRAELKKAQADLRAQSEAAAKAAEASRRELDGVRRELKEAPEQLQRIREARDRAQSDNTQLLDRTAELQRQAEQAEQRTAQLQRKVVETEARTTEVLHKIIQAEARSAEEKQRADSLERELLGAKEAEKAKAREDASKEAKQAEAEKRLRDEIAQLEKARSDEVARLEAARREDQQSMEALRRTMADLARRLAEAQAKPPAAPPAPAAVVPPPPAPAVVIAPPAAPSVRSESGAMEEKAAAPKIPAAEQVPGQNSSTDTTLRPQNTFGPNAEDGQPAYLLLDIMSRDDLGVVYRASERASGRKFMARFMAGQAGEEQTQLIERSVEKLIELPHPNLLHVQGSGRRKNRLYLMMDLVEAPTLGQARIQEVPRICAILRDAAAAVHYAHEEGIFHGGITPEAILVASEGGQDKALVKEFGLGFLQEAMVTPAAAKDAPTAFRSPAFLPPEQLRTLKAPLSAAVDVYGLGATLYAALAGRPPFEGKDPVKLSKRVMIEEPLPVEKIRAGVPEAVGAIVRRSMAKERGLRYATAQDMSAALTRVLGAM